jgi:hypothetical protein
LRQQGPPRARRGEGVVDEGDHDDAEHDHGDAGHGGVEGALRLVDLTQRDDRHGVAGQHRAVGPRVLQELGDEDAEAEPHGEAEEQQHPVLAEQGHEDERHHGADQRAEEAVDRLRDRLPALGLGEDRHAGGGGRGAVELEPEGGGQCQHHGDPDPQREGPGGRLRHPGIEERHDAVDERCGAAIRGGCGGGLSHAGPGAARCPPPVRTEKGPSSPRVSRQRAADV